MSNFLPQVHFKKQQNGLVDVEFKAWDLMIGGLHGLRIENLHVVRHIGLKDIRESLLDAASTVSIS